MVRIERMVSLIALQACMLARSRRLGRDRGQARGRGWGRVPPLTCLPMVMRTAGLVSSVVIREAECSCTSSTPARCPAPCSPRPPHTTSHTPPLSHLIFSKN